MAYYKILDAIQSFMTQVGTLQVTNKDKITKGITVRIYNNQVERMMTEDKDWIPRPCVLVEIVNNQDYQALGEGYRIADITFRCHILQDFMNQDGTQDQTLLIFSLRDSLISLLNLWSPTGCGPLVAVSEIQEYDHVNVYHYVVDFKAAFVDGAGSIKGRTQMDVASQLIITLAEDPDKQYGPVPPQD